MEALDVQVDRFGAPDQRNPLAHPLVLGDDPIAGLARLPVVGAAPDTGDAAVHRERAVRELLADEEPQALWLHEIPRGQGGDHARFTGVLTPMRHQEARVQATLRIAWRRIGEPGALDRHAGGGVDDPTVYVRLARGSAQAAIPGLD
jgi:hypothetical protein